MDNSAEQRSLRVGSRVGVFEVVALLGAGGMGEVWRARDPRLGRDVAVKVLPKRFASDPDRLRRFEHEARTLASLNHPNILVVFETGQQEGAPYLVSELLEGRTLRQELSGGALPARKATDYAMQVAQGLAAAHARGVIHRDLKPDNLFLTTDGRIKILDFGLAKLLDPPLHQGADEPSPPDSLEATTVSQPTGSGVLLGTPGYMSPEQVRGQPADQRSDIFAFGAILYELLSGQKPFRRGTSIETLHRILFHDPPDLREAHPNISPLLESIVRRCLEKEPGNRFQTAKDLAFAIESARAAAPVSEVTEPPPPAGNAAEFGFRSEIPSTITAGMSSPEPKTPTLQELPQLRSKTERISSVLKEQLSGHLETLRPLFAPERLFGKLAGGKAEAPGIERTLVELQHSYRAFTAKPYDLPGSFDTSWLGLIGQVIGLDPWEYEITVQGKSIAMTSPIKWVLLYRSNYTLAQVKRVLAGVEPVRLDYLRQFVVNALASILRSFRPPDDLVLAATAFSGVPAFIELIDLEAAKHPRNPLQQKLDELLREQ
jgi:serine/threonine protein kinase